MSETPPTEPPEAVISAPEAPAYPEDAYPEDAYAADGTDLTLIRAMLRKTPTERLETAQAHATAVLKVWRELGYR